jgi:hypothetical protein
VTGFGPRLSSAALLAGVVSVASCGAPLMKVPKLPAGAATPASDGSMVLSQATSTCRAIDTMTLEMNVHGSANGHRLRGQLTAGLARPASARLEAVASFGQPLFVFVARNDEGSLLLPRDARVLEHGNPADILDAVTGVPVDPEGLRALVSACLRASGAANAADVKSLGDDWRTTADDVDTVYFRRDASANQWRLVARVHPGGGAATGWRADYANFERDLPRTVRLVSQPAGRFDLQLDLSQIETNVPLGAEVFRLQQTDRAAPITLDELRQSGPLGQK